METNTIAFARLRTIEIADLGVGDLENVGLEIVQYINNDRYCAKELVLFPWQMCLEHRHLYRPEGAQSLKLGQKAKGQEGRK